MSTLSGKQILIVGGTSGIGFAVAKLSLLSLAAHVIIASSSSEKVQNAVVTLRQVIQERSLPGVVSGEVLDASNPGQVRTLFDSIGEIDHLVWTSGDPVDRAVGFPHIDTDKLKDVFDIRFWGPATAAQAAKFRPGGSIILTSGVAVVKPLKDWSIIAGVTGAVDSLARGLAVDLAPVRVNTVSPGAINTDIFNDLPADRKEHLMGLIADRCLIKSIGEPDAIAEAYLFLMKCNYITGQRIEVDGGVKYA